MGLDSSNFRLSSISRRDAFVRSAASVLATGSIVTNAGRPVSASAAPQIFTLESGIKYATTKEATSSQIAQQGDIVAVDYTG